MQLRDVTPAHDFPALERRYQNATRWRKPDHGEHARPAGHHRKKYVSIRPVEHGYACRYHNTDVVIWLLPSNAPEIVTIQAWPSISTNTFAEAFSPSNLRFDFAHDDGFYVFVGGHWGETYEQRVFEWRSNTMTFRRNELGFFAPSPDDVRPYEFIDSRSPLLKVALNKTAYLDFSKWLNAVASFDKFPHTKARARVSTDTTMLNAIKEADELFARFGLQNLLANAEHWMALWHTSHLADKNNEHSPIARAEHIKQQLRKAIYRDASLPPRHDMGYATPEQHAAQRKLRNIWC